MKLPQLSLRELFWLVLGVAAMVLLAVAGIGAYTFAQMDAAARRRTLLEQEQEEQDWKQMIETEQRRADDLDKRIREQLERIKQHESP